VRRFEPWIAVLFFALLAGLEIAHGVTRLNALRTMRRQEIVDQAARELSDLASEIRSKGTEGKRHAAFVARLPDASALATTGDAASRKALAPQVLALLASFPEIDRVRILADDGRELFRSERMGGGVAAMPEALLATGPDVAAKDIGARLAAGEVAVSDLFIDRDRVEVPESERKVVHYVAKPASSSVPGTVVLTVYASPVLDQVRRFTPVEGAKSVLVTKSGAYVASPDRAREIGGAAASILSADRPEAGPVLSGAERVEANDRVFLASSTGDLPWLVVTEIPESAIATATTRMTRDHWLVIAGMIATLVVLLAGAVLFHRLALRAFRVREAEAALRQLEQVRAMERRLATADRLGSLGLLTAGVAHEINNPLEGIGNYLSLLDRDDLDPEKRRRYVDSVRHGFERIRKVVANLLGFARQKPGTGLADLKRAVDHAIELARFSKQCREVKFDLSSENGPVIVTGEEGAFEQVLLNLFLNAGQSMGGRGRIAVRLRSSPEDVVVEVDDEGAGIAAAHLDRIFDPFFTTGEGSGLGLSVSYGIAQAHGGTLVAENLPGRGARFTLRLPAMKQEGTLSEHPPA
jgi:signal transduction histidine kinase